MCGCEALGQLEHLPTYPQLDASQTLLTARVGSHALSLSTAAKELEAHYLAIYNRCLAVAA